MGSFLCRLGRAFLSLFSRSYRMLPTTNLDTCLHPGCQQATASVYLMSSNPVPAEINSTRGHIQPPQLEGVQSLPPLWTSSIPVPAKIHSSQGNVCIRKNNPLIKNIPLELDADFSAKDIIMTTMKGMHLGKTLQTGNNYLLVQGIRRSMSEVEVSLFVRTVIFDQLTDDAFHFAYTIDPPDYKPFRLEPFFVRFTTQALAHHVMYDFNNKVVNDMLIRITPLIPLTEDVRKLTANSLDIPMAVKNAHSVPVPSATCPGPLQASRLLVTSIGMHSAQSSFFDPVVPPDINGITTNDLPGISQPYSPNGLINDAMVTRVQYLDNVGSSKMKTTITDSSITCSKSLDSVGLSMTKKAIHRRNRRLSRKKPKSVLDEGMSTPEHDNSPSENTMVPATSHSLDTPSPHPSIKHLVQNVQLPGSFPYTILPQNGRQLLVENDLIADANYVLISGLPVEQIERLSIINRFCAGNFRNASLDLILEADTITAHLRYLVRTFLDPFPANLINLIFMSSGREFDYPFCVVSSCAFVQCNSLVEAQSIAMLKNNTVLTLDQNTRFEFQTLPQLPPLQIVAVSELIFPRITNYFVRRSTQLSLIIRPPLGLDTLHSTNITYVTSKKLIDRISNSDMVQAEQIGCQVRNCLVLIEIGLSDDELLSLISDLHNSILHCLMKNKGIKWGSVNQKGDSLKRSIYSVRSQGSSSKKPKIVININKEQLSKSLLQQPTHTNSSLETDLQEQNNRFDLPRSSGLRSGPIEEPISLSKYVLDSQQVSILKSVSAKFGNGLNVAANTSPLSKYGTPVDAAQPVLAETRQPETETSMLRHILTKIATNSLDCDPVPLIPVVMRLATSSEMNQYLASIILIALIENKGNFSSGQSSRLASIEPNEAEQNVVSPQRETISTPIKEQVQNNAYISGDGSIDSPVVIEPDVDEERDMALVSSLDSLLTEALALMDKKSFV